MDSPRKEVITAAQRKPFIACVSTAAGEAGQKPKFGSRCSNSRGAEIAIEINVLVSGFLYTIM